MGKYRILSLDGGGVKGIVTSIILQRLDTALPGWRDGIKLIAGTSTGGIIGLGLAAGIEPAIMRDIYYNRSPYIFADSALDNAFDLGNTIGAQYDTHNLRVELQRIFGNLTLADLPIHVLIPAFDLDNSQPASNRIWAPKFFHNFESDDSDGMYRAADVALYTSAAPTYFPTVDGYIDGGVVANNPSMAALAQAQDHDCQERCPTLGEIRLLSLGSGHVHRYIKDRNKPHDWGWSQWARPIINIMMDGLQGVADYQCRQMLGQNRYHRLDPHLDFEMNMDEWRRRDQLVEVAETLDLDMTLSWLQKYWLGD